jgi:hypothetical protein
MGRALQYRFFVEESTTRSLGNAPDAQMDTFCREENAFTRRWEWTRRAKGTDRGDFARSVHWAFTCQVTNALRSTTGAQNLTTRDQCAWSVSTRPHKARDVREERN